MILLRLFYRFFSVIGAVHFHSVLLKTETYSLYNQFFIIHH